MLEVGIGDMNKSDCSSWNRTICRRSFPNFIRCGYLALQARQQHLIDPIVPGKTDMRQVAAW